MAVLFLQGPMGPFFRKLVSKLKDQGREAYKIDFNGGDAWYSRGISSTPFTGTVQEWPDFLTAFVNDYKINSICVFGDCRLYHRLAKTVTEKLGINFYAFEEGYIRPNHLTLEKNGVNGYSEIAIDGLPEWEDVDIPDENVMGGTLLNRVRYCFLYYNMVHFQSKKFPHYEHHRTLVRSFETKSWFRALGRHYLYKFTEFGIQKNLIQHHDNQYFLVPLQVYNDAQLRFHSPYSSIEEFIRATLNSFKQYADKKDLIVFKHHPMDRGHCHYGELLDYLSVDLNLEGRIIYCHDQHLPTLLKHSKGVITINSTTAISAFYHSASVKVMGEAFYDIKGLCSQQSLDDFWKQPEPIDYELFLRLRNFLVNHGQVNASYNRKHNISTDAVIEQMKKNNMFLNS